MTGLTKATANRLKKLMDDTKYENGVPVIYCYPFFSEYRFECPYCNIWEYHRHLGFNKAKCTNKDSPYNTTGIILKLREKHAK